MRRCGRSSASGLRSAAGAIHISTAITIMAVDAIAGENRNRSRITDTDTAGYRYGDAAMGELSAVLAAWILSRHLLQQSLLRSIAEFARFDSSIRASTTGADIRSRVDRCSTRAIGMHFVCDDARSALPILSAARRQSIQLRVENIDHGPHQSDNKPAATMPSSCFWFAHFRLVCLFFVRYSTVAREILLHHGRRCRVEQTECAHSDQTTITCKRNVGRAPIQFRAQEDFARYAAITRHRSKSA